jgi:hypothetical protein
MPPIKKIIKQEGVKILTPEKIGQNLKGLFNKGIAKVPDNKNLTQIKEIATIAGAAGDIDFDTNPITSLKSGALEELPLWDSIDSYNKKAFFDTREDKSKSPSTAGGLFPSNIISEIEEENECIRISEELDEILKKLPDGGDCYDEITNDMYIRVGAVNNTNPAVRVNNKGGLIHSGVMHGDNGPANTFNSTPLVEQTGNDANFPCGNYTISCGNKFNVLAATGGISLKTAGVSELAGVATKVTGTHAIEMSTSGSMSIGAGRGLSISAETLNLSQSKGGQVAVGGSLGVENQLTVGGSASINGELYCQHITGPASMQVTEQTAEVNGWTNPGEAVAYIPEGRTIGRLTPEICAAIYQLGQTASPGSFADKGYVEVPAFNGDGEFKLGVPPEYEYNETPDLWAEKEKTGFINNERKEPVLGDMPAAELEGKNLWSGTGGGAVPLQGTGRITGLTIEAHDHPFKSIAMSLRSSPSDVTKEAGMLDRYAQIRSIAKGQVAGKVRVRETREDGSISDSADKIVSHLKSAQERIDKFFA